MLSLLNYEIQFKSLIKTITYSSSITSGAGRGSSSPRLIKSHWELLGMLGILFAGSLWRSFGGAKKDCCKSFELRLLACWEIEAPKSLPSPAMSGNERSASFGKEAGKALSCDFGGESRCAVSESWPFKSVST